MAELTSSQVLAQQTKTDKKLVDILQESIDGLQDSVDGLQDSVDDLQSKKVKTASIGLK
jgi:hypothetical protein